MLSPTGTDILAIVMLLGVLLIPVVAAVRRLRRSRYTPTMELIMLVCALWARLMWRTKVHGKIESPPGRGAIVVCNHNSAVDPWFTFLASERLIRWLVAAEYNNHPALSWFFRRAGTIPVNRGGIDTSATKRAIRMAQNEEIVGLFPEGRINYTRELLLPGRPGAALVAMKARVPIVPCYVYGAPRCESMVKTFFTPSKSHVIVGPTIDIEPFLAREHEDGVLQDLTRRILTEIATLAGQPQYPIRIAGRKWKPGMEEENDAEQNGDNRPSSE